MNDEIDVGYELEVKILIRAIPRDMSNGDVSVDVYRAVIQALSAKYAIVGYSWRS